MYAGQKWNVHFIRLHADCVGAITVWLIIIGLAIWVSVQSVVFSFYGGDEDMIARYRTIASARGVDWRQVYAVDAVRYDMELSKGNITQSVGVFIERNSRTKTIRIRTLSEVIAILRLQKQSELIWDFASNLSDDSYGEKNGLTSDEIMALKAAEEKYGISWKVLAAVFKINMSSWTGINLGSVVWNDRIDGNGDGKIDYSTADDLIFSLAHYINTHHLAHNPVVILQAMGSTRTQKELDEYVVDFESGIGEKNLSVYPTPDYRIITSVFGLRINPVTGLPESHKGIDFAAPEGAIIVAIADGKVVSTIPPESSGGYGNLTIIQHSNGVQSWYAHQSAFTVRPGMYVSKGQAIGLVGATGQATGPHLHLEIRVSGVPQNPLPYLTSGELPR